MEQVSVRYIVRDIRASVVFYTDVLGFSVSIDAAPGFAALDRGALRLLLNCAGGPSGGAAPMPDGRLPEPGGWNRIQLPVQDLPAEVERLRAAGCRFRNDIVAGRGGQQILVEDPSGNVVELFQPAG